MGERGRGRRGKEGRGREKEKEPGTWNLRGGERGSVSSVQCRILVKWREKSTLRVQADQLLSANYIGHLNDAWTTPLAGRAQEESQEKSTVRDKWGGGAVVAKAAGEIGFKLTGIIVCRANTSES